MTDSGWSESDPMADFGDQLAKSEVFLDIDEGVLIARIENLPALADAEYAFYLQRDGKRIETRWYTGEPHARFTTQPEMGRYRAIGFVRCCGKTQMLVSISLQRCAPRSAGGPLDSLLLQRGSLCELASLLPTTGRVRLDLSVPGSPYEYQCLLIRQPGKRLFVIFGGAIPDRTKAVLPRFSRFTWAPDFPGSVLCIADPTLLLGDKVQLGWYFGKADADATAGLVTVVSGFAASLGYGHAQIVTYGSSGGGFAAMQVAARIGGGRLPSPSMHR